MILFDGHDLCELFLCGTPDFKILNSEVTYYDTPGRNGALMAQRTWGVSTVEFPIAVVGNAAQRRAAFSTLGAWLNVDEPKKLVFPDTPERYYMAVPEGEVAIERGVDNEIGTLKFTLVDPIAYGKECEITVPSGGSVTFRVDGTYSTRPTITADAAVRKTTSPFAWRLTLDNGDYLNLALGNNSAHALAIDCENRTSKMDGAVLLPTTSSDWFEFSPGEHTVAMTYGTGAAVIKWRERWL